jgi:hypothetical protein
MHKAISIDIETLGTNIDSQIISVGACIFDIKTGKIHQDTFYFPVSLPQDVNINATAGTIKFWLQQAVDNPEALKGLLDDKHPFIDLAKVLVDLHLYIGKHQPETVWANGTKFDLGMLEYQYKRLGLELPWKHNMDRDMRTLRHFAPNLDIDVVDMQAVPHNALSDAIWQAKFISQACFELGIL